MKVILEQGKSYYGYGYSISRQPIIGKLMIMHIHEEIAQDTLIRYLIKNHSLDSSGSVLNPIEGMINKSNFAFFKTGKELLNNVTLDICFLEDLRQHYDEDLKLLLLNLKLLLLNLDHEMFLEAKEKALQELDTFSYNTAFYTQLDELKSFTEKHYDAILSKLYSV